MVTLPVSLNDPNYPKSPIFYVLRLPSYLWLKLESSYFVNMYVVSSIRHTKITPKWARSGHVTHFKFWGSIISQERLQLELSKFCKQVVYRVLVFGRQVGLPLMSVVRVT